MYYKYLKSIAIPATAISHRAGPLVGKDLYTYAK